MRKHFLKCVAFASALLLPGTRAGADTTILTEEAGYHRVDAMPGDDALADYYFVIVDKDNDLMMTLETGGLQDGHKAWYYRKSSDPAEDLNKVWMIEANNDVNDVTTGGYAFRCKGEPTYLMQTTTGGAWNFRVETQETPNDLTQFIFRDTTVNGIKYWMFENGKYPMTSGTGNNRGFVGPWNANEFTDGAGTAANKRNNENDPQDGKKGVFAIYSILRTTFDALHDSEFKAEANKRIEEYQSVLDNSDADDGTKQAFQAAIETAKGAVGIADGEDDIEAALAELETARQDYVQNAAPQAGHPFDMTFLIKNAEGTSTDGWSRTGSPDANVVFVQTNNQHWSGPGRSFLEIDNWSAGSWNGSMSQTVTLPNGKYTLRAAGRAEKNDAVSLSLTANGQTYKFPNVGDTGGTIATDGSEWESVDAGKAEGKTFAHDGAGFGWEWSKLDAITVDADTLEIKAEASATVEHMWTSISDFQLMMTEKAAEEDGDAAEAKQALQTVIDSAGNIPATNVGTEAFQRPQDKYDALQTAIGTANEAKDAPGNTAKEYNAAADALQAAIDDFWNAELNRPDPNKRYNVVVSVDGYTYNGNAITFVAGENSNYGGYDIQLAREVDPNFAQAFTFTPVDTLPNAYTLSMTDSTGQERYLCTGKGYGRSETYYTALYTITDAEKALPVRIQLTDKEGIYKLLDTDSKDFPIGARTATRVELRAQKGNTRSDFKLQEAAEATVKLDMQEGWATLILPFNIKADSIPTGLQAYTWSGTLKEDTLALDSVKGDLVANTPYIVSSDFKKSYEFSGFGLASDTIYAAEHMKGYFVVCKADAASYVLQKQGDELAFCKVESDIPDMQPYTVCLRNVEGGNDTLRLPKIAEDRQDLQALVDSVKGAFTGVNVGTAAFQIPQEAYDALQEAVAAADNTAKEDKSAEEYRAAAAALRAAVDEYNVKKAELNKPEEGKRYNVVFAAEDADRYDCAVTYVPDGMDAHGGYTLRASRKVDPNFAQAFTFTAVDAASNKYTLSMTDADGAERYVCAGQTAYNEASSIYTTTDKEKALAVEVRLTDKEGVYKLYDTEDAVHLGISSSEEEVKAMPDNVMDYLREFKLQEAAEATVTLDVQDGWATLILPFNAEIPEGLQAYTWNGAVEEDATTLVLDSVEGGLAANTPYIVSSESAVPYEFNGFGLASDTVYADTAGYMKGYFAAGKADSASYVLQKQGDELAFYKVESDIPDVQPYTVSLTNFEGGNAILNLPEIVEDATEDRQALEALVDSVKGAFTGVNVGTAAFQIPQEAYDALQEAVAAADNTAKEDKSAEEYRAAAAALRAAVDEYNVKKAELNKPEEGKRYNVVFAAEDADRYDCAVTYVPDGMDAHGGYTLRASRKVDPNFAQAFTFTAVDAASNKYTLSMTDADGQERYVCSGQTAYSADSSIYTTTDKEKALAVEVRLTDKEGVYKLYDTEDSVHLGISSSEEEVKAMPDNVMDYLREFKLQEAAEATVTLDVQDGWATLILPFNAEIPEGLQAYTWNGAVEEDATTLVLDSVEGGLAANTPYIVSSESAGPYEFNGFGLASDTVYADTAGYMKGYFAADKADSASYVLQKQGDELAFYKVESDIPDVQPYTVCLKDVDGTGYAALKLPSDEVPDRVAGAAADETPVDVYSINGILVRSKVAAGKALEGLSKGIYIVDGKKKVVK